MTKVRGIRGATTADENTRDSIIEATTDLLERIVEANDIEVDDVAAAWFTATQDLTAEFPALAARRRLGWDNVALMCAHEMDVENAQNRCIRALIMVNTSKSAQELQNIYVRGAKNLRSRGVESP